MCLIWLTVGFGNVQPRAGSSLRMNITGLEVFTELKLNLAHRRLNCDRQAFKSGPLNLNLKPTLYFLG